MVERISRSVRTNRPLVVVGAMLSAGVLFVMTLRIIEHGFAFGQWLASRTP